MSKADKKSTPVPPSTTVDGEAAGAATTQVDALRQELKVALEQVAAAQEGERRALADYQNLVRRTQEAQQKMTKFASWSILQQLVGPFEHLYLAKEQLKDKGLDMVFAQFQHALESEGLKEVVCLGKEFDSATMEVVDRQPVDDVGQVNRVLKVVQRGYTLHGDVVVHAKVIIGVQN